MKKGWALICAAFFFLCAISAAAQNLEILRDARIRAEPNDSADNTVTHVRKGTIVPVVEHSGQWYKVTHNGETGWIYSSLAREVPSRVQAGEVFTKQDVSVLPPTLENEGAGAKVRYARITKSSTQIRSHVDPNHEDAYIIHTVRGKDELFIFRGGTSWCLVECKDTPGLAKCRIDTVGWVRCTDIEVLDDLPTKSALIDDAKSVFIGLIALGVVIFIIIVIVTMRHIKAERRRNVYIQKNVLIIAKEPKMVQYTLTNAAAPVERCFSELGFGVTLVKDSVVARNNIEHSMPDLILIDWNFETAIFSKIENLFARLTTADKTYLLFFNVPDLSSAPTSKILRNVSFLGITVSDRDIFKVVTPLLVHAEQQASSKDIQKSVQRCALEGEIDGGNLLEVLQFIEIGSKTGCLMVETKGPFGLVYFRDGMITYAAAAKGQGVEAVYAILNQPFGKFRFITNKQPKTANLNLPTLHVLMEWTKEKDEAGRR